MDWHHWVHNTQDEDTKKPKTTEHNMCGHHHTQDTRRRQTHKNTTQYVLDTIIHKTQDEDKHTKTQHNMC
jgi:hypothetical protein